jgi:hypothetical protein
MRRIAGVVFLLLVFWAVALFAQAPAQPPMQGELTPTEVQSLRIQVKAKDLQIAFINWQNALSDLKNYGEQVKTENHWDPKTVFNLDRLVFIAPPPPAKPEAPKPEAKKP